MHVVEVDPCSNQLNSLPLLCYASSASVNPTSSPSGNSTTPIPSPTTAPQTTVVGSPSTESKWPNNEHLYISIKNMISIRHISIILCYVFLLANTLYLLAQRFGYFYWWPCFMASIFILFKRQWSFLTIMFSPSLTSFSCTYFCLLLKIDPCTHSM